MGGRFRPHTGHSGFMLVGQEGTESRPLWAGGGTIAMTAVCTIILSVVAHGISANPLVAALAARIKRPDG